MNKKPVSVRLILSIAFLVMLCVGAVSAERIADSKPAVAVFKAASPGAVQAGQCSGPATNDLTEGVTTDDLVTSLVGNGVTFSNVVYSGDDRSAGTFSNGGVFGIPTGIVLSSGDIRYIEGPNVADSISLNTGLPGDADLNKLIPGYTSYDATILEFDFIPASSVLQFSFVFASDEYNEYANTNYNDVFGFFVNGNDVSDNVALIPGTSTPVSVNNVNGGRPYGTNAQNAAYFNNNDLSDGGGAYCTEMDGFTDVFTATVNVNPGQTNHIKLAIADAGDHILDSNVMIEGGSFSSPKLTLTPLKAENDCGDAHTVTAKLVDEVGAPVAGETVTFTVVSGPNAGKQADKVTDANGEASWTYTSAGTGMDTIQATAFGEVSNPAYKTWTGTCVPEFPTLAVPVMALLGMAFVIFSLNVRKE